MELVNSRYTSQVKRIIKNLNILNCLPLSQITPWSNEKFTINGIAKRIRITKGRTRWRRKTVLSLSKSIETIFFMISPEIKNNLRSGKKIISPDNLLYNVGHVMNCPSKMFGLPLFFASSYLTNSHCCVYRANVIANWPDLVEN